MHCLLHTFSPALCRDPPEIVHGMLDSITGNCIGDTAHYICDDGFKLNGNPYITCTRLDLYTAEFQPEPPTCDREYCTNIAEWLHAALVV